MDHHSGALLRAQQATDLYDRLSEDENIAFLPMLAGSLNNLAMCRSNVGDHAGALDPARRAVANFEQLTKVSPDAFQPQLAASLSTLGGILLATEAPAQAVTAYSRALAGFKTCFDKLPQRFERCLIVAVNRLAEALRRIGHESALLAELRGILENELAAKMMAYRHQPPGPPRADQAHDQR